MRNPNFAAAMQRSRDLKSELTQERILAIAARKDVFEVTWKWRYDWLRKRGGQMVKKGLLRRKRGAPGCSYFAITEAGRKALEDK